MWPQGPTSTGLPRGQSSGWPHQQPGKRLGCRTGQPGPGGPRGAGGACVSACGPVGVSVCLCLRTCVSLCVCMCVRPSGAMPNSSWRSWCASQPHLQVTGSSSRAACLLSETRYAQRIELLLLSRSCGCKARTRFWVFLHSRLVPPRWGQGTGDRDSHLLGALRTRCRDPAPLGRVAEGVRPSGGAQGITRVAGAGSSS